MQRIRTNIVFYIILIHYKNQDFMDIIRLYPFYQC